MCLTLFDWGLCRAKNELWLSWPNRVLPCVWGRRPAKSFDEIGRCIDRALFSGTCPIVVRTTSELPWVGRNTGMLIETIWTLERIHVYSSMKSIIIFSLENIICAHDYTYSISFMFHLWHNVYILLFLFLLSFFSFVNLNQHTLSS